MIIEDSGTEFFVQKYGFDCFYIRLSDCNSYLSIELNKEQLHELYQYIKTCTSEPPIGDVLQHGIDLEIDAK